MPFSLVFPDPDMVISCCISFQAPQTQQTPKSSCYFFHILVISLFPVLLKVCDDFTNHLSLQTGMLSIVITLFYPGRNGVMTG